MCVCVCVCVNRRPALLTGGPQTLGRGHGGTSSKRISHKQLSIIANTHTGVALIRGLHTKNCSGIALGGGPWQALTNDDEVEGRIAPYISPVSPLYLPCISLYLPTPPRSRGASHRPTMRRAT